MVTKNTRIRKPESRIGNPNPCPQDALQNSRDELTRRLRHLEYNMSIPPELLGEDPDPLLQENTKNLVIARQLEAHLQTIDRALRAANRGEYGICERCHQPIPPERLQVVPEARLCVRCKSKEEKSSRGRLP